MEQPSSAIRAHTYFTYIDLFSSASCKYVLQIMSVFMCQQRNQNISIICNWSAHV